MDRWLRVELPGKVKYDSDLNQGFKGFAHGPLFWDPVILAGFVLWALFVFCMWYT